MMSPRRNRRGRRARRLRSRSVGRARRLWRTTTKGGDESGGDVEISLAHSYTEDQPQHRCGAQVIADEVAEADVGMTVEIFPASQLGGDADRISSVVSGDIDMDIQGASALGAVYEPVSVLDAAYAFDDAEHLARYFDRDSVRRADPGFADETGVSTLGAWSAGMRQFTANKPIREPGDLEGLRMRFPNSPQFLMNAEALGADATEVAYEELFLALQQGTVDGQENPIVNIDAINLDEVQDYISLSSHQANTNLVIIGEVWNELSVGAAGSAAGGRRRCCRAGSGLRGRGRAGDARRVGGDRRPRGHRRRRRGGLPHAGRLLPARELQRGAAGDLRVDPRNRSSDHVGGGPDVPGSRSAPPTLGRRSCTSTSFVGHPELDLNFPHPEWDESEMVDTAVEGLDRLWDLGVHTVVDLTVLGLGRDVPASARVAERTRVHVVAATGYYTADVLPPSSTPTAPACLVDGPDPLVQFFLHDIEDGIAGTGVRAAMVKVVTDQPGLTPDVQRVLMAAAVAHQQTGVPITTHTHARHRTAASSRRSSPATASRRAAHHRPLR